MPREHFSRISLAAPRITIALGPPTITVTVVRVLTGVGLTRLVSRPATKSARIIVALAAVVVAIAWIKIVAIRSMIPRITQVPSYSGLVEFIVAISVAIVVSVAWVVSPPRIVKHERSFDPPHHG